MLCLWLWHDKHIFKFLHTFLIYNILLFSFIRITRPRFFASQTSTITIIIIMIFKIFNFLQRNQLWPFISFRILFLLVDFYRRNTELHLLRRQYKEIWRIRTIKKLWFIVITSLITSIHNLWLIWKTMANTHIWYTEFIIIVI